MPIFFRGAGVGTYWQQNDARVSGFLPHMPGMNATHNRLMQHIAQATTASPYVSLTRSYGVALTYAMEGRAPSTREDPAYIYEIELDDPLPRGLILLDPIKEVASNVPPPTGMPYQHDGSPSFLIGVVDPKNQSHFLSDICPQPSGATPRPANLSTELVTIVRALRDAELLALGTIPANCVTNRIAIF